MPEQRAAAIQVSVLLETIYTDITKCNIKEPLQKYHLGRFSDRLLGGRHKYFYWAQPLLSASAVDATFFCMNFKRP